MLAAIVMIPAIIAAIMAFNHSVQKAFAYVYIPVLLFLPYFYYWNLPGLPDLNFQQATILPIFGIWILKGAPGWRWSYIDILVFGFALLVSTSEYLNSGYKEAQNIVIDMIASVVMPYVLAKSIIEPHWRITIAKHMVLAMSAASILSIPQFLMGMRYTLWHVVLGRFFSGQGWQWAADKRWGFTRINGPYGHTILAGIILVVGYRIQRWLEWSRAWPKYIAAFPLPVAPVLSFIMLGGALMTLVRGPLSGGILAGIVILVSRSQKRWMWFSIIVMFVIVVGSPLVAWFIDYASVGRQNATSATQETVAYRWELISTYIDSANEQFVLGWGKNGWPRNPVQPSIDNYYLLLFLMHGFFALIFLVGLIIIMMLRLFFFDMFKPVVKPLGSSFGFTLSTLFLVYGWSIATVWLGMQTLPLFFLLVGWSDAYLYHGIQNTLVTITPDTKPSLDQFRFKRVLK